MFLSILTQEEKQLFLNLAYTLACSDGEFGPEEKQLFAAYCQEMDTTFDPPQNPLDLQEQLAELKKVVLKNNRKVIYFELLGMAMADGRYSDEEKAILEKLRESFELPSEFSTQCHTILEQYFEIQESLTNLLLG